MQHGPLSARGELQSHPLAGQAQACGRLTEGGWAGGPDGTYRDHWYSHRRKNPSHASSLCSGPRQSFSIVSREIHNLCVSSLRQSHAIITVSESRNFRNAQRPSSYFAVVRKTLARSFHQYLHSRIMRVILAQGSCPVLQILDVSSQKNRSHAILLPKKVCTCHPCTKGHAKLLCAKKKKENVQPIPCRRENRHYCEGSPLFRDIRTFGRAVEVSSFSPLRNTMGGLSK